VREQIGKVYALEQPLGHWPFRINEHGRAEEIAGGSVIEQRGDEGRLLCPLTREKITSVVEHDRAIFYG
jgi:hypothetical protein